MHLLQLVHSNVMFEIYYTCAQARPFFPIWDARNSAKVKTYLNLVFSSPEPKAQRRAYRILMVRRPSVVNNFKHLLLQTACPIKVKFYVEPPWVGGTKVCSRHLGHMTKMAATPIYGKNPSKIFFSRTGGPIFTKLGM